MYASEQNVFSLCHVAESLEELEFFQKGDGNLTNLIKKSGSLHINQREKGSVSYMEKNNLISDNMHIVHANFVSDDEIAILKEKKSSIVVCPRSYLRFSHNSFPLLKYLDQGINVALGTESLALSEFKTRGRCFCWSRRMFY